MAARLEAGWDHDRIGTATIEVNEGSGVVVISITTGTYCHTDLSSVVGSGLYTDFATQLEIDLNAHGSLSETYTVLWQPTSMTYAIDVSGTGASLDFNGTAGALMRNILGFSGFQALATSHTSDVQPYFVIPAETDGWSDASDDYEMNDVAFGAAADDGTTYSIAKTGSPIMNDFTAALEPKAKVFRRAALSTAEWTFQDLFQHCRGTEPIMRVDGSESSVHRLRAEHAHFKPQRAVVDFDDLWSVDFRTFSLGYL